MVLIFTGIFLLFYNFYGKTGMAGNEERQHAMEAHQGALS